MKKISLIILIFVVSISFNACGGGGGDSSSSSTQTIIDINVKCAGDTQAAIDTYVDLYSGDTIVKDEAGTIIQTYNTASNPSKVCLVNGKAHIVRP